MKPAFKCSKHFILIFTLLLLTSCATQLAPAYDKALFTSLTNTNVKTMELFASVAGGTQAANCDKRLDSYNALIGSVDALALQSKARPVPQSATLEKANNYLISRGMPVFDDDTPPSASALEQVSVQISKMKQVDCRDGLNPIVVATFRNAIIISMDQAITYESFLNR